jgi:membrane protein DedA with SNARE-associated domain
MEEFIMEFLDWLMELGYFGIMFGLMVEVIPSEIVLAYGGYLVGLDQISFVGAVIFGTIGGVLAQLFLYWLGYYGGRPVVEKYGKYILISKKHLDVSEQWFNRYGTVVIFAARFIPVVRHAISIPAGIAKMGFWRFTILTTLAVVPWSIAFIYLGMQLGKHWDQIDQVAGPYVYKIAIIMGVILALYLAYNLFFKKKPKVDI